MYASASGRKLLISTMAVVVVMGLAAPSRLQAQGLPLGSLSFVSGYTFERSNLGGNASNLNGWFASVGYSLKPWLTMGGQFTNYLGAESGHAAVSETFAVGPTFSFRSSRKVKPLTYVLLGYQRAQMQGRVNNQFELQVGGGVQVAMTHDLDLKIVPAEYDVTESSGTSTYVTSIGLVIKFPKKK